MSKKILIGVSSLLFIGVIGCRKIETSEDVIFKSNCTRFDKLLQSYLKIKETKSIEKRDDKHVIIIGNCKRHFKFIQSTKEEWNTIASKFEEFVVRNPKSEWADDALFLLGHVYSLLSWPGDIADYTSKAIETYKQFYLNYPNGNIEEWTKKRLRKTLWSDTAVKARSIGCPEAISETAKLQIYTRLQIAGGMLRQQDYTNAITVYHEIIKEYPNSGIAQTAKQYIDDCQQKLKEN